MPQINTKKNSPNHFNGRNGWKPDMICNHITEGGYSGAVSWLCNTASGASSHFVVSKTGLITQLVDLTDGSWCNGNSTSSSSRLYYKNSLNAIVRSRATNANYYTVSIEHEGYSYKDRYGALTEEQYQATLWLHRYIISEVKRLYGIDIPIDREHIIGHYEIDPTGKPACPAPNKGKNFPFDRLIADLKAGTADKADKLINKHLLVIKDVTAYSNAGYGDATSAIIKEGTIVYGAKKNTAHGLYLALKDENKKDYLSPAAWVNNFDSFEVLEGYVAGKLGKYLKANKDVTAYSTAGYNGSTTGKIVSGQIVYCDKIHTKNGLYYAMKDANTGEYLKEAWVKATDVNNFSVVDNYVPKIAVNQVQITNISTELEVGDTLELSVEIKPDNATNKTCSVYTSDVNIAVVNGKTLVAKSAGKVTIKVECDGKSATKDFIIIKSEEPVTPTPTPTPIPEPIPEEPKEEPVVTPEVTPEPEVPAEPVTPSKPENTSDGIIKTIIKVIVEVIEDIIEKIFKK